MNLVDVVGMVVTLVFMALIFYAVVWYIDWVAPPEPFNKIIKALVGLVALLLLIGLLFGYVPHAGMIFRSH